MIDGQLTPLSELLISVDSSRVSTLHESEKITFYSDIVKKFPWVKKNKEFRNFRCKQTMCFVLRDLSYGGVRDSTVELLYFKNRALHSAWILKEDSVQLRWRNDFSNGLLFLADEKVRRVTLWDLGLRELFVDASQCTELRIGYNHLAKLRLSHCINIRLLDCRGNYFLENINVSGASCLEELYCENCGIETLDASQCLLLSRVDCRDCAKLSSLNLRGNTRLEFLCINRCSSLALVRAADSTQLQELSLLGCVALSEDKLQVSPECSVK